MKITQILKQIVGTVVLLLFVTAAQLILVTGNATFHVSRKTKQFIENQLHWLTVIFLPKRSPNLNPVETRVNRNLKKDVCANYNYGTEENLVKAVRRYLRCKGSWPKL